MNIRKYIFQNYPLMLILVLAAALRLYKPDFQSMWVDEVLTMNASNPDLSLKQFYDHVLFWEYIPHLFFFLNRIIFSVFGFTVLAGRIFSAVIGIFGVYGIYLLGKEIYNKKAGLVAALVLAVNIFHIAYSQEMRPYGMLFLFTVLSFYRLLKFLKTPSYKNGIYYGVFTSLILHSHFFGLITIFAQSLILLYFLIITDRDKKISFLKYCITAGITAIIVFLPTVMTLFRFSGINSFWVEPPKPDVYTTMFSAFFGQSSSVLFLLAIIVLVYFVNLTKEDIDEYKPKQLTGNKLILGFIVMFAWLFLSLYVPLIKSYLDIPMILHRYFINILPVFIITVAIGLVLIKKRLIRFCLIFAVVFFSLLNLFVEKDYYHTVTKTQLRELTDAIKAKNDAHIVSYWRWIFDHFFPQHPVEESTLEGYVLKMQSGIIKHKPFWYADANSQPYTLSHQGQKYLNEHFILSDSLEFYDAWAKYYVPKQIEIKKVKSRDLTDEDNIRYSLERFSYREGIINARGWAFLEGEATDGNIIKLVLIDDADNVYEVVTENYQRDDVTQFFGKPLSNSGFYSSYLLKGIPKGQYRVGLFIENKSVHKEGITLFEKKINIK